MRNTNLEQTFEARVRELYALHQAEHASLERRLVRHANTKREIGILLREWSNHESASFQFFEAHKDAIPFGFEDGKGFVAVAKTVPKAATNLTGLRRIIQDSFFGAIKRMRKHQAVARPPLVEFIKGLHASELRLQSWAQDEPVERWSDDRKATVAAELDWAIELHGRVNSGDAKQC